MNGEEVLIPLAFFVFLGGVLIVHLTSRHKERMAMVEKGMSSEDIKALYVRQVSSNPLASLKWGILLVFAGAALLLGQYLTSQYHLEEEVLAGILILFVGVGLLLFHSIAAKKSQT
jgi:hypothetical protein